MYKNVSMLVVLVLSSSCFPVNLRFLEYIIATLQFVVFKKTHCRTRSAGTSSCLCLSYRTTSKDVKPLSWVLSPLSSRYSVAVSYSPHLCAVYDLSTKPHPTNFRLSLFCSDKGLAFEMSTVVSRATALLLFTNSMLFCHRNSINKYTPPLKSVYWIPKITTFL